MEKSFGEFLREKRQEKNLTQKKLSKMLFVSDSTISKWEKDVAYPDITLLPRLSKILGVTEHELITASIDNKAREEKIQAKKWRVISMSWSLFFYISYIVALITCFICNIAINKTLSWFWIVACSLLLAFTFTHLSKLIKKYKLILIPLSIFLALILLLAVCCIYNKGDWFFIVSLSILFGYSIIFLPIYLAKFNIFSKIKKYSAYICIALDFILLNILLFVISNGESWYIKIALPITFYVYIALNIILLTKFINLNKLIKTSCVLILSCIFLYVPPLLIKVQNPLVQIEIDSFNVLNSNLLNWSNETLIESNVHCIILLSTITLAVIFLVAGLIKRFNKRK